MGTNTEPPVDQTSPSDAGHTTTEYRLTRALIVGLGVVAGATVSFAGLHAAMPDVAWITTAATLVGSIGAAAVLAARYLSGRAEVKVALANLEAARAMAAGKPDAVATDLAKALNAELAGRLPPSP